MTKEEAIKLFDNKMTATVEYGMRDTQYIKLAIENMAEVMAAAIEDKTEAKK